MPEDPYSLDDETSGDNPWVWKTVDGIPYMFNTQTGALIPQALFGEYQKAGNAQSILDRFSTFFRTAGPYAPSRLSSAYSGAQNLLNNYQGGVQDYGAYMGMGGGGGGSQAHYAFEYDPFSQELQARQLEESIRQANMANQVDLLNAGYNRSTLLNSVLSNPANVFSSWFQARGMVPPENAQLANILNIPGGGNPWFGALPPMPTMPTVGAPPTVPTPQPPQPIPYARGGTNIPAEPAVAIGLWSGQPLFTFNENAPMQTEKVKITPQKGKVPSFATGGTAFSLPGPTLGGTFRGTPSGTEAGLPLPDFLQDLYNRPEQDFPQFPWLTSLGEGRMPGRSQVGLSLSGFPVPSLQALNQMSPSEQTGLANFFNTVLGVPAEDVFWQARQGVSGLRSGIPAMNRMG